MRLRTAESLPVGLVEADVHLFRGRLEVRHLKTLGPVPILWDRWELASPFAPRLLLEDLLATAAPSTELMLDLKGAGTRLAGRIAGALAEHAAGRAVTVCSRNWRLLEPLRDSGARLVHSVGSPRQLRDLGGVTDIAGVSIHRKLLDARTTAALKERTPLLMTWPVVTLAEARALAAWGVDGVITERYAELAPALAAPVPAPEVAAA